MVTSRLLDVTFSSCSCTNYKIADPDLVREAIQAISSRFTKLHFAPYTEQEFIKVSQRVLTTRESTSGDNAEYIARVLWRTHGQNADVRQCVQIGRQRVTNR